MTRDRYRKKPSSLYSSVGDSTLLMGDPRPRKICLLYRSNTLLVSHLIRNETPCCLCTDNRPKEEELFASRCDCRLLPLATVVTPNLAEAAALNNDRPVTTIQDMKDAAVKLHAKGPKCVLIKGGHLEESSDRGTLYTSTYLSTASHIV